MYMLAYDFESLALILFCVTIYERKESLHIPLHSQLFASSEIHFENGEVAPEISRSKQTDKKKKIFSKYCIYCRMYLVKLKSRYFNGLFYTIFLIIGSKLF